MNKLKKPALGKGLSALLKDAATDITSSGVFPVGSVSQIPIDAVEANPFQPRTEFNEVALQELCDSIKVHGVIQPITVRKLGYDKYQLISGERRTRAARLAGLKDIPAFIRIANDQEMLEMALIENIQREDLNAIEVSISYQRLVEECSLSLEELGERVGKSRSTVNNYLRLLKLPSEIQVAIRDGKITMGHARAIINIENEQDQMILFQQIVEQDLSVRAIESLVRERKNKQSNETKKAKTTDWSHYEHKLNDLADKYEMPVRIKGREFGGELIVVFNSEEALEKLLEKL
jgi:ParB family chromosome partitioning protein